VVFLLSYTLKQAININALTMAKTQPTAKKNNLLTQKKQITSMLSAAFN